MLLSKWQCMLRNKSIKCESNWPITKNWDKLQNETGGSSKNTNWLTIRSNFKLEIQAHKTLTTDAPMALLCTTANFFGGKYDLFQLHRQIIHQNDGISMINWLESSPLAQLRKVTRLHLLFGLFFVPADSQLSEISPTVETTVLLFLLLYLSCKGCTVCCWYIWSFPLNGT